MRALIGRTPFGIALLFVCVPVAAQLAPSVAIKEKKAFVIEFNPPYTAMVVDMDADEFIDTDNLIWTITPQTVFNRGKKKPIAASMIRRGMELEITGESTMDGKRATIVKLVTDPSDWKDEVNGYLESVEGDIAWIDGRRVKLAPGVKLKGEDKEMFTSFNGIPSGRHMDLSGRVLNDGILEVTGGTAKVNSYGPSDVTMFRLARASGALPPADKLAGGTAVVGGRKVKFSDNFELQAYVTKIGNRLVPQYTREMPDDFAGKLTWRFAVIEDESFNAFAMPDGAVFVHTGLLKQVKNEAQLAAVLGHEIAHATHEHARKKYEKDQWLSLLGGLLGPFAQGVAGDLGNLAMGLTMLGIRGDYSRDREAQSDRVGLYYMAQAGYDPREAPRVWSEVAKENKRNEPLQRAAALANGQPFNLSSLPLFGSHPKARVRVKNLNRLIAQNYHDIDYRTLKVGEKEYMNVVGSYFGWRPQKVTVTVPSGAGVTPLVGSSATKTGLPFNIRAYLNKTYPRWKYASASTNCNEEFRRSSVSGDFNGDGRADHVVKFSAARRGYIVAFISQAKGHRPVVLESGTLSNMKEQGLAFAGRGETYAEIVDEEFNRVTRTLKNDVPVGGICESSAYLYVFTGAAFRRAFTSD